VGATVGLAWDAGAGALLVAVDGKDPTPLFPEGLKPGPAVGVGLFPALSGQDGCRVRVNLGLLAFRHAPPAGFLPCFSAAPAALAQVCVARAVPHCLMLIFYESFVVTVARCQDAEESHDAVMWQVRKSAGELPWLRRGTAAVSCHILIIMFAASFPRAQGGRGPGTAWHAGPYPGAAGRWY
jgi:hypothetical protein